MSASFPKKISQINSILRQSDPKNNPFLSNDANLNNELFYQVLNSSDEIIFIFSKNNEIIQFANSKAVDLFQPLAEANQQKNNVRFSELFESESYNSLKESLNILTPENDATFTLEHQGEEGLINITFSISLIPALSDDWVLCKGVAENISINYSDGVIIDHQRLEDILQNSESLYFEMSVRGYIHFVSNSIKNLTGYTKDEVKNKNLFEFYANKSDKNKHHKELLEKGEINNSRIDLIDKYGKIRNVVANSKVVKDEKGTPIKIVGSLRDETETNILISLLEESESKYRTLLDNAGAIIIYLKKDGEIILINKKASIFFGMEALDLMNKNFFDNPITNSIAENLQIPFSEVIDNKKGQVLETNFEFSGQEISLLSNLQPVFDSKNLIEGVVIIASNVSDERQAQREMRKLQIAIEQSTASITISDKNGIIEYANSRYCELTGFSSDNLIGKKDYIFSEKNSKKKYFTEMHQKLNAKDVWKGEFENLKKNGELYWEKVFISPVFSEYGELINFISVREDITDSKRIEKIEQETLKNIKVLNETSLSFLKLDEEANVFKLIGDQLTQIIPDTYFLIGSYNPDSKMIKNEYININQTILNQFYSKSKFTNFKVNVPLHDDQMEILRMGDWQYFENGLTQLTGGGISPKMSSFLMTTFNIESIKRKGIFKGDVLLGTLAIISRNNQQEIDLNLVNTFLNQVSIGLDRFNLQQDVIHAKNKAEEMNRIKSTFLANMSHELRTPLIGILGFSELLMDQIKEDRYSNMISVINKSGLRLLDTLNTILDFSTIEGNNVTLNYIEEDIVETVRKVIQENIEEANLKGLFLKLQTEISSLRTYTANSLVEKVIGQLIKNGIKFTNKGGIEVKIRENDSSDHRKIHISIIDSGIGISQSNLENIFQEFRQESEGLTRRFEGTGLGLTISKKFASLLNGTIEVSSVPDKGSEFTLIIPHYTSPPLNILN
ncbi:MAG: PAS domain S-box protein [Bacteroidales bacterium]|nr:PAS domain S-box protein [Bacteroidales bacterium]MCF8390394.1 PAS domain S-box protein [Bacteroidales bacterium]